MKQKTLYIILALCLAVIIILLTMIVMSQLYKTNMNSQSNSDSNSSSKNPIQHKIVLNRGSNFNYPVYEDIDYAYDYDGYWFQPSIWWNNLWNRRRNVYDRRDTYDRRDGLDMHNRYINNPLHQAHNQAHPTQQSSIPVNFEIHKLPLTEPPINRISLVKPDSGSLFPLPTLSSSINIMPEEIAMSPMSGMHSEPSVQSISTFVSDISASYPTGYISNFNYKGPDKTNSSPLPIDVMASQAIGLQQHTIGNQIIVPPIVMEHPN